MRTAGAEPRRSAKRATLETSGEYLLTSALVMRAGDGNRTALSAWEADRSSQPGPPTSQDD